MKNALNLLCITFSLMISYFFLIDFKSSIYAQEFQVNPNDYFYSKQNPTNSQTTATTNSEDTIKENCINNQIESVLYSNNDAGSDSYFSNFHFIKKFDSEGKFINMWGQEGKKKGEFKKPWGVAVDSSGNVYVADQTLPRVQKFDSNGKFIDMWGKEGKKERSICTPTRYNSRL